MRKKCPKTTPGNKNEPRKLEPPPSSPFRTIPQFGKEFFGLSKNGSYSAADRGDFDKLAEIINVGRRRYVRLKT
jgi:hypothetical protein